MKNDDIFFNINQIKFKGTVVNPTIPLFLNITIHLKNVITELIKVQKDDLSMHYLQRVPKKTWEFSDEFDIVFVMN